MLGEQNSHHGSLYGTATDEGLKRFVADTYRIMSYGIFMTATTAFLTASAPEFVTWLTGWPTIVMFLAILAIVFCADSIFHRASTGTSLAVFMGLSVVYGLVLTPYILSHTGTDITSALAATGVMFLGASLFGLVTGRDLSGLSGFCVMALIGLIVVMVLNVSMIQSGLLDMAISAAVVLVVAVITSLEAQQVKTAYHMSVRDDASKRSAYALSGALGLYISFVTMFIHMLNLFGSDD